MRAANDRGFSLIEMMITVGIVAILLAIAVPIYDIYQAKTRQGEAKVNLAAIYAAERSFQGEYNTYISSLEALNFRPEGAKRFYTIGWSADQAGTVDGFHGSLEMPYLERSGVPPEYGCAPAAGVSSLPAPVTIPAGNFTVGAVGEIRMGRGCDLWTINDEKQYANPTAGI